MMKSLKVKRWVAGLCAAAMLAGVPAMVGYATETTLNNSDTNRTGNTEVKAEVVANDNEPTYEIVIPQTVDFGQIQQPTTDADAYASTTITVRCTRAENLESGNVVAVLVKDGTAQDEKSPFKLTNSMGNELQYEMLTDAGESIQRNTWFPNGYLYASFTGGGQSSEKTLRLNKAQLYGKDLTTWGSQYSGTLEFTTRIASVNDVQSMEGGTPVAW